MEGQTADALAKFRAIPRRLLADTCILSTIHDEGAYLFDGGLPNDADEDYPEPELEALQKIIAVNQRASFQFVVSPLTIAELANEQKTGLVARRLSWALEVLDDWFFVLDAGGDRQSKGGTVRHRFKLSKELQELELRLMEIPHFRQDPIDRLLLIQTRMANCDAFLTMDRQSILAHHRELGALGISVLLPSEFWAKLAPWSALWV